MTEILRQQGEALCARMVSEIYKLGFTPEQIAHLPVYDQASFETSKDPYSGEDTVLGQWRSERGSRLGEMKFHGDGSFYAEYDVVLPHPTDPAWFVIGVVAWGRDNVIKSEPKLESALGD